MARTYITILEISDLTNLRLSCTKCKAEYVYKVGNPFSLTCPNPSCDQLWGSRNPSQPGLGRLLIQMLNDLAGPHDDPFTIRFEVDTDQLTGGKAHE